jgi:hypothetical protein
MSLLELYRILLKVGITVSHYEAELDDYPYVYYKEVATSFKYASGQPVREDVLVEIIHFTQKAFDPSFELLKNQLHKNKLGFAVAHLYDPETKAIANQLEVTITKDLEVEHD